MRLNDSSGHVWETVLDAVSVGYDIYDIYNNGLSWESGLSLAADVGGLAVPFIPSAGTCIRWCDDAVQYSDEAVEYGAKAVDYVGDKVDEGVEAAKDLFGMGDEAATDIGKAADNIPCPVNSFSGETLVMTPSGTKPIAELVEGDLVLAYNEATGTIGAYPIVDTISHVDPEIVLLTIDSETLETTAEHPFYELESAPWLAAGQTEGRWTDALQLKAGDRVWKADGTNGVIQSVAVVSVQQRMYNLTVAEAHTFFVGHEQWLVHNCSAFDDLAQMRQSLSLSDRDVLARLDINGQSFYGVNGPGVQHPKLPNVTYQSLRHAEGDAFSQAIASGIQGGEANLFVDSTPCPFCRNSLAGYAKALGLNKMNVYTPEGLYGWYDAVKGVFVLAPK